MYLHYSSGVSSVNPGRDIPQSQVAIYNGFTEFKAPPQLTHNENKGGGKRRPIKNFSPASRRCLLKRLFALSEYPSLFITLTYPKVYPEDCTEWKRHLDNLSRDLKRNYPGSWFIWKLEPQKRGAPHYHLIGQLGLVENIHLLRKYLSETWYRICDTGDPKHLKAGVQADYINDSVGKMRAYVCKYVGKGDASETQYPEWATPGRFWGVIGRENLPPVLVHAIDLTEKDFYRIKRLVRKWLKRLSPSSKRYADRIKQLHSFFILTDNRPVKRLVEFIMGFPIDEPRPAEDYILQRYQFPIYD